MHEVGTDQTDQLWMACGYPPSFLAKSDRAAAAWRKRKANPDPTPFSHIVYENDVQFVVELNKLQIRAGNPEHIDCDRDLPKMVMDFLLYGLWLQKEGTVSQAAAVINDLLPFAPTFFNVPSKAEKMNLFYKDLLHETVLNLSRGSISGIETSRGETQADRVSFSEENLAELIGQWRRFAVSEQIDR